MYMDNFLQQLNSAPAELTRQFKLMQSLDERAKQLVLEANQKAAHIRALKTKGSVAPAEMLKEMKSVREVYRKAICLSDDKCLVAEQVFDMIDKYVKKLDANLVHFKEDIVKSLQESEQAVPEELMRRGKPAANKLRNMMRHRKKNTDPDRAMAIGIRDLSLNDGAEGAETDAIEPVVCSCRRTSFGPMVACDNSACEVEWYHFECVQLVETPKEKWLCPKCSDKKKSE